MSPRKRARGSSSSSAAAADAPAVLTLSGGDACPAGFKELRLQQILCDVELHVGHTEFHAHRIVLAVGSPYFKGLYTTSMDDTCRLEQISAPAFEAVLDWLYEGTCIVPETVLVPLLEAAVFLQVNALTSAVVMAVIERLSVASCVGAWGLGMRYDLPRLEAAGLGQCKRLFSGLNVDSLSAEQFGELLDSDELHVLHEGEVFDKFTHWLGAQQSPVPPEAVATLVRKIRFEVMDEATRSRVADAPALQSFALMKILAKSSGSGRQPRKWKPPSGVLHNINNALIDSWTQHYDMPYEDTTTIDILDSVPTSASWIFVGARDPDGNIALGAVGERNAVLQRTVKNSPHENNGVYWYLTEEYSFGFSPNAEIRQTIADTSEGATADDRLSWHMDNVSGGFRAGRMCEGLDEDIENWRKLIYYT